mmetsp:Transcript_18954/g.54613  ORF Transcript_18954/g.54613 Transcript_18954/m.54613 type:complete len:108 (+) Transcript_18954:4676-4999(+)
MKRFARRYCSGDYFSLPRICIEKNRHSLAHSVRYRERAANLRDDKSILLSARLPQHFDRTLRVSKVGRSDHPYSAPTASATGVSSLIATSVSTEALELGIIVPTVCV